MVWISLALVIVGIYAAKVLKRDLHEKKLLELRKVVHAERMAALDHDREWPESAVADVETAISRSNESQAGPAIPDRTPLQWVRWTALAIGLAGLFGGIGAMAGIYFLPDADMKGTWPLGLIPVFLGLGMLLFYRISRGMTETRSSGQEKP